MKRRFYIYKRGRYYYVQLKNPLTGGNLPAKSTGTGDREEAEYIANKWLFEGIPEEKTEDPRTNKEIFTVDEILHNLKNVGNLVEKDVKRFLQYFKSEGYITDYHLKGSCEQTLIGYLSDFWSWDKSLYIKERKAHGHGVTKSHVNDMFRWIQNYWKPYFGQLLLTELTRQQVKEFTVHLSNVTKTCGKGTLSFQSINIILKAGSTALKWAHDNGDIDVNPAANIMKFSGSPRKRGVLTMEEVQKLFLEGDWRHNEAVKLANLLAVQTGMRAGEILGLQTQDIQHDRIIIRRSYSRTDGLKGTKTGNERQVPLLPETRDLLFDLANKNPHGCSFDSFVFFQVGTPDRPIRQETLRARLKCALESIGICREEQNTRNLTFHGHRHFFSYQMAKVIDTRAMKLTGHSSQSVFEGYVMHSNENDFRVSAEAAKASFEILHIGNVS